MTIWQIILLISACGAMGGIVNCAISGEFNYPRFDAAAKVWRPGWIGNVLVEMPRSPGVVGGGVDYWPRAWPRSTIQSNSSRSKSARSARRVVPRLER
jgi:hypothetical protein